VTRPTTTPAAVLPPQVRRGTLMACRSRSCDQVVLLGCASCGWSAVEQQQPDLFGGIHDETECTRRQLDPAYRQQQDRLSRAAAGLP